MPKEPYAPELLACLIRLMCPDLVDLMLLGAELPAAGAFLSALQPHMRLEVLHLEKCTIHGDVSALVPSVALHASLRHLSLRSIILPDPCDITPLACCTQLEHLDLINEGVVVVGLEEVLRLCQGLNTLMLDTLGKVPGSLLSSVSLKCLHVFNWMLSTAPIPDDVHFPALKEVVVSCLYFWPHDVGTAVGEAEHLAERMRQSAGLLRAWPARAEADELYLHGPLGGEGEQWREVTGLLLSALQPLVGSRFTHSVHVLRVLNFHFAPTSVTSLAAVFPAVVDLTLSTCNLSGASLIEAVKSFASLSRLTLFFSKRLHSSLLAACSVAADAHRPFTVTLKGPDPSERDACMTEWAAMSSAFPGGCVVQIC